MVVRHNEALDPSVICRGAKGLRQPIHLLSLDRRGQQLEFVPSRRDIIDQPDEFTLFSNGRLRLFRRYPANPPCPSETAEAFLRDLIGPRHFARGKGKRKLWS